MAITTKVISVDNALGNPRETPTAIAVTPTQLAQAAAQVAGTAVAAADMDMGGFRIKNLPNTFPPPDLADAVSADVAIQIVNQFLYNQGHGIVDYIQSVALDPNTQSGTTITSDNNADLTPDGDHIQNGQEFLVCLEGGTKNGIATVINRGDAGSSRWEILLRDPLPGQIIFPGFLLKAASGTINGGKWFRCLVGGVAGTDAMTFQQAIPEITSDGIVDTALIATAGANVSAATGGKARWVRMGNIVFVTGVVDIDPALPATPSAVLLDVPISDNDFGIDDEAAGTGASSSVSLSGRIMARVGTRTVKLEFTSTADVGLTTWAYHYSYSVV